ncbi:50S ribosomal L29, chloroplastic-like protein [Quillaja saponaria]|uniref:Large ribosomal subunit protein uL29c n=1 Tax=Quillaja saponaria TaxID=32244 RepID=A0AAD7KTC1_QUISA|nr:50S ribosomal L29, chloroplastic-like protein [Quillaja saponaria]
MNFSIVASPSTISFSPKPFSVIPKSTFNGIQLRRICSFQPHFTTTSSRSPASSVVMMAKKEEELKEIRAKTTEEINEEVIDLKGELLMLRLQKSARNEFKSSEFSRMRKRIARMLTVKRERELEEGINKRLSRKLDRKWKKSIVVRPPPSLKKLREEEEAAEAEKAA